MKTKLKLVNLGYKVNQDNNTIQASSLTTKLPTKVTYPSIQLNATKLGKPAITMDEEVKIIFNAKVTSLSKPYEWDIRDRLYDKDDVLVRFDLTEGKILDNETPKTTQQALVGAIKKYKKQ